MKRFEKAVENIIVNCLRVQKLDRVVVITERERIEIGEAIAQRAREVATNTKVIVIEDHVKRPAKELPQSLIDELVAFKPTVSIYAATGCPGELPAFRFPLIDHLVKVHQVRHGHMIGIDEQLMLSGMSLDYGAVQKAIGKLYKILKPARKIKVTCPFGTDLTVRLSPKLRWVPCSGLITDPGEWSNLPEGEIFTCPQRVDGKVVAWVIGDHFSEEYGILKEPVEFEIKNSRVVEVSSKNLKLLKELRRYLGEHKNGDRVGEFAIGALLGLTQLTGNLLQDEKFPGVHMAFGHTYPDKTGAKWDSLSHVDVIPLKVTVEIDGEVVMRNGAFTVDLN